MNHYIAPDLGHIQLVKLQPKHVENMVRRQLVEGIPPISVRHHLAVLRNALNAAMRWGYLARNVASLVSAPPVPDRSARALSTDDARAILDAVKGDRFETVYTVALVCGLRQSESLALTWDDVDLLGRSIRVWRSMQRDMGEYRFMPTKTTHSTRTIVIPEPVVASLRAHRARQNEERLRAGEEWVGAEWGGLVFCNPLGGPASGSSVSRQFRKILVRAGLPDMRYHDLRRASASLMAALGVPPRVAMEVLGHANISTTMEVYALVAQEFQRDAADRVSEALWASG